jgi:hypothetical protein
LLKAKSARESFISLAIFKHLMFSLLILTDSPAAANIVFLKPGGITSQEGKSLKVISVIRNEIQCFKSRLQKYKKRYGQVEITRILLLKKNYKPLKLIVNA